MFASIMKQLASFILLFIIGTTCVVSMNSCANIIPPGGGLKDTLAPKLIVSLPKDSTTNFTSNKIVLTFDEFVEAKEITEQVVVSPNPKNQPIIEYKLRNVTIKLRDSLEPNTTYSINFGNSIRDVNEGNIAKNFTYVFATGNNIDNNGFTGKVILAENGKIDSTLIVVLHQNLSDTAVLKKAPRYYAKLKGDGTFSFQYLPKAKFNVFALPNGYSKTYNDSTALFAFLDSSICINGSNTPITLYAFEEAKKKASTTSSSQVATQPKTNSNNTNQDKRLRYNVGLEAGNRVDLITPTFTLDFNKKLKTVDSSKIILTDTSFKPLADYHFVQDSNGTRLHVKHTWQPDTYYKLIIKKDAVIDTAGNTLAKADTIKFATKREAEYGSLKIRFNNLDTTKHPVLQIIKGNEIVEAISIKQRDFSRKLFMPGEYELRILLDKNNNGIWDAGNYKQKKQPEIVKQLDKKLGIRANWDNETEINLQ
jgi:hypothetical protein